MPFALKILEQLFDVSKPQPSEKPTLSPSTENAGPRPLTIQRILDLYDEGQVYLTPCPDDSETVH